MTHFWARCCTSSFHNVSFLCTDFLFMVSEAKSISSHHQDIVDDSCNTWIGSFSFHLDIEMEIFLRMEPAGNETYGRKWKKWGLVSITNSCAFWQGSLIHCQTAPRARGQVSLLCLSSEHQDLPEERTSCFVIQKTVGRQWVLHCWI